MNVQDLIAQIQTKKSFLCVGLDTDLSKIPAHFDQSMKGLVAFNRAIIEATSAYAISYKINTAFYEQYGADGWKAMEQTLALIPDDCFTIADAKRGDIGNTGKMYAKAFLENMNFDSITVSPYMGRDSVEPFMESGKVVIVLGLTSNSGSSDFQQVKTEEGFLYETVLKKAATWGSPDNMMFVVGATKAESLQNIRRILPNHFLLVPGVGSQGGSLTEVAENGSNANCGLLVNSSRGIIYAGNGLDFAEKAKQEAKKLQEQMAVYL
ncbi:MAG: orotidine-5'-phosphate decarboxylase [Bacteroidia bacterium]|jgi:orotidine-5'-phosphate decarboxylase